MSREQDQGHCEVIGIGAAEAVPDVVVVDARVQVDADDVAGALARCAERAEQTLLAATAQGVQARDLQTTGIGVSPRWDHQGQRIIGHTAHTSFRCLVRDRDALGTLLTQLAHTAGDALAIDGVRLQVGDPAALLATAREAAFDDARAKAADYSRLADRRLGRVLLVSEVTGPGGGGPHPKFREMAGDAMAAGMPVAAGESSVTASVLVRWELVDR